MLRSACDNVFLIKMRHSTASETKRSFIDTYPRALQLAHCAVQVLPELVDLLVESGLGHHGAFQLPYPHLHLPAGLLKLALELRDGL